jgi:hypothetical protein
MSDDRSFERNARAWLELGPTDAPNRVVQGALLEIASTPQERGLWIPWRLPNMNPFGRLVAGVATIAVVLAVGGILVGPRLGPGGSPPTPAPTPSSIPIGPASTASDAACKLITTDEARNSTNNPGVGATTGPTGNGAVTTCVYSSGGGDIILVLTYTNPGGQAAFNVIKASAGMQPVANVGSDAVFDPTTETLYVRKGDALVAVRSGLFVTDRLAAETQLGRLAAGRI